MLRVAARIARSRAPSTASVAARSSTHASEFLDTRVTVRPLLPRATVGARARGEPALAPRAGARRRDRRDQGARRRARGERGRRPRARARGHGGAAPARSPSEARALARRRGATTRARADGLAARAVARAVAQRLLRHGLPAVIPFPGSPKRPFARAGGSRSCSSLVLSREVLSPVTRFQNAPRTTTNQSLRSAAPAAASPCRLRAVLRSAAAAAAAASPSRVRALTPSRSRRPASPASPRL